jgi:hypothetical protein
MKKRLWIASLYLALAPLAGKCAPTVAIPPLAGYQQPVAKCITASPQKMITMVSPFFDEADLQNLEIVATAQPQINNDPDPPPIFTDDATLNIFDSQCRLLYEVQFPEALEISFETLHWGSSKLLYFAAVVEGADDVHYEHYFLDQGLTPVGPALESDERLDAVYVGTLGPGRGFGVAQRLLPSSDWMGEQRDPQTVFAIYPWRQLTLRNGRTLDGFEGPIVLDGGTGKWSVGQGRSCGTEWFPLLYYLFGPECGG